MYMVGVGLEEIFSLKVAVMVTVSLPTVRSLSEQLRVTVGVVVSTTNVILSVPVNAFPARSSPENVAV